MMRENKAIFVLNAKRKTLSEESIRKHFGDWGDLDFSKYCFETNKHE